MPRRLTSLCSGVGGLDLAVEQALDAETIAYCEDAAGPARVFGAHWPGRPNHGDVKQLAWAEESTDIVSAGYPCQPFSLNGRRLGHDDPRHLYPWISDGIAKLRPEYVALENVRGHLTLGWAVVVADLDRLGYDVRWTLCRASDVGAPHERARLFALARDRDRGGWPTLDRRPIAELTPTGEWVHVDGGLFGHVPYGLPPTAGRQVGGTIWAAPVAARLDVLPMLGTPRSGGAGMRPSPAAVARGETHRRLEQQIAVHLPTPTARDWKMTGPHDVEKSTGAPLSALPLLLNGGGIADRYRDLIARWEQLTRPAPAPLVDGLLSAAFVEWMMGLPDGWVTAPELWPGQHGTRRRKAQVIALGNAVVPQQASAALELLSRV